MYKLSRRKLLCSGAVLSAGSLLGESTSLPYERLAGAFLAEKEVRPAKDAPSGKYAGAARIKYLIDMVHHNPGEPQFITKYTDPLYIRSLGYNAQAVKIYIQAAICYDRYAPGLISPDSATWAWIQRYAHNLDHLIAGHKQKGMPIYPFTDVLVIPIELLNRFGDEMRDEQGKISIQKQRTQEIVRAQVEAIFDRFPDVDGMTIRFGETYLSDTPFHLGGSPVHSAADHSVLMNLLREELCVKRNKVLIYRTWDFDMLHTHADLYLEATNNVEPHPKLIFSIKHTNGDFVRDVPLNTTLGIGKHQQIVEVSMMQAGCYGKGAYPYYIGRGVLHGWFEMNPPRGIDHLIRDGKIAGIYTWPRGDGWGGPYISSEFWVDLNLYVISQFGQRPWLNDQDLFEEYCRKKLRIGKSDTKKLYRLCLLSEHATFIGTQSLIFHIEPWWQRDDKLNDVDLRAVDHQKVLTEKAQAVSEWKKIEALAREIRLNKPEDQEYLQVSSTWGRIYFSIIEQLWTLQILEYGERNSKNRSEMRVALKKYDALWAEWQTLERDHSCCATLYMTFWPQTFPPTWREHPYRGNAVPNHDTQMIARCRAAIG